MVNRSSPKALQGEEYAVEVGPGQAYLGLVAGSVAVFDTDLPPATKGDLTAIGVGPGSRKRVYRLNGKKPPQWMQAQANHVGVEAPDAGAEMFMIVPWDWVPHRLVRVLPPQPAVQMNVRPQRPAGEGSAVSIHGFARRTG
jgi:hypothetical protein